MTHDGRRAGSLATILRGLRGRCPRCGGRGVHDGFFRLAERCPTCGHRFAREEGFVAGVYLVNIAVTEGALWFLLMGWVLWRAGTGATGAIWPVLVVALVVAALAPIAFYPRAATTWAALDLVLRPLEPEEEADAATWLASRPGAAPTP